VAFDFVGDDAFVVFSFAAADAVAAGWIIVFVGGFVGAVDGLVAAGDVAVTGSAVCFGDVDLGLLVLMKSEKEVNTYEIVVLILLHPLAHRVHEP
jgi:hypothetical protein